MGSVPVYCKNPERLNTHLSPTQTGIMSQACSNLTSSTPDREDIHVYIIPGTQPPSAVWKTSPNNSIRWDIHESILLSYSGDTPVENADRWDHSETLIHEATFIDLKDKTPHHSLLEEVMEMAASISIKRLILGHFSSRYDAITIDAHIRQLAVKYQISIPIYRVLPGQTHYDILGGNPINM
jgi:hypothetical protein